MSAPRIFAPLFRRRFIPVPTWRVWVAVLLLFLVAVWLVPPRVYRILAVTCPLNDGLLVIEGWVPDVAVKNGVERFRSGGYGHIVTTGVPIEQGAFLAGYGTTAEVARATCIALGVDSIQVSAAPVRGHVIRDRTLASAYALRRWVERSAPQVRRIDILTQGVHARRTWRTFSRVLGDSITVGIIASHETGYNENNWWKRSAGVKDVIGEVLGYAYTLVVPLEPPAED